MPNFLQPTQTEAHINRLTAIKTQLQGYVERDGRAVEALPAIDEAIRALSAEPFAPDNEVSEVDDDATPIAGVNEVE